MMIPLSLTTNYTALHDASRIGDIETVSFFLNLPNYPIDTPGINGLTAFTVAILNKQEEVIMKFLQHMNSISFNDLLQIIDKELINVFLYVYRQFHFPLSAEIISAIISTCNNTLFDFLVIENAMFYTFATPTCETPYMLAICFNNHYAANYLRFLNQDHLAKIVFLSKDIIYFKFAYIKFLIQHEILIVIEGNPLSNILLVFLKAYGIRATEELVESGLMCGDAYHRAVKDNNIWLIDTLYYLYPQFINQLDSKGNTPLMNSKSSIMTIHLIKLGACINHQNKKGETALFRAVRLGNFYISRALIHAGINKKHRNHKSQDCTQYILATSRFSHRIINLLT